MFLMAQRPFANLGLQLKLVATSLSDQGGRCEMGSDATLYHRGHHDRTHLQHALRDAAGQRDL